jgi:hypothetical protein
MELNQHANVNTLDVTVRYIGGILVDVRNGTALNQLNLNVNLGGVQLNADASSLPSNAAVDVTVNIGGLSLGVDVNAAQVGVGVDAAVDFGGVTVDTSYFSGTVSAMQCSVRTDGFGGATHKLNVVANVGLGGVNVHKGVQTLFR